MNHQRLEHIMGMPIGIDVRDDDAEPAAIGDELMRLLQPNALESRLDLARSIEEHRKQEE